MNWPKAVEAFAEWENQIRRKWFFHELKKNKKKQGNEYATQEEEEDERDGVKYKECPGMVSQTGLLQLQHQK